MERSAARSASTCLPNKVLSKEHWTASPDEEVLAAALGKTRQLLATAKPGTKR